MQQQVYDVDDETGSWPPTGEAGGEVTGAHVPCPVTDGFETGWEDGGYENGGWESGEVDSGDASSGLDDEGSGEDEGNAEDSYESAICGDGIVSPGEACDEGPNNGPQAPCTDQCRMQGPQ